MKNGMNRVLCAVFGFYLMLVFLLFQLTGCLVGYFFNGDVIRKRLVNQGVADEILSLVQEQCNAIADSCGLTYEVYSGVFSKETILSDLNDAIGCAVSLKEYSFDDAEMIRELTDNVKKELAEVDGVEDFSEYEDQIAVFAKQSVNVYKDHISLNIYRYFEKIYHYTEKYLKIVLCVAAAIAVVAVFMLFRITGKGMAVLREIAWSMISSGLLLACVSGYLHFSGILSKLQFQPQYFRDALRSYLTDGVRVVLLVSIATFLAGVLLSLKTLRTFWQGGKADGTDEPLNKTGQNKELQEESN